MHGCAYDFSRVKASSGLDVIFFDVRIGSQTLNLQSDLTVTCGRPKDSLKFREARPPFWNKLSSSHLGFIHLLYSLIVLL